MKIQRQCRALADELTNRVRNQLIDDVNKYCADRESKKPYKKPDSELHVDENDNTVLVGGSLSGDLSNTSMCLVAEGVDVEIGEGSLVLGCIFTRLSLSSIYSDDVKELDVQHTIRIGKNCILVGCLFRDDCDIGDNAVMAASGVAQGTIAKDSRLFLSSVLLRYGSVGERFTAVQTLFHADKCKVGTDAFMMSGKYGIISWEPAIKDLYGEIDSRCKFITYNNAIQNTVNDCFQHGLEYYDNQTEVQRLAEENPDDISYKYAPPPTAYRKQYLQLDRVARMMKFTNAITCFYAKDLTVDSATFRPMAVVLRDRINCSNADREWDNYDERKYTFRDVFNYDPRIRVGNNVQFYWSLPICVCRIEQESYASWQRRRVKPCGFDSFTWNKFNGYDYDLEIGDDCVITSCADWSCAKPPTHYERAGRFLMRNGVTLYVPTDKDSDVSFVDSLTSVDILADTSRSLRLSPRVEYIFEDNTKVFLRQAVNWQEKSSSYVWRIKVKPGEMAVI